MAKKSNTPSPEFKKFLRDSVSSCLKAAGLCHSVNICYIDQQYGDSDGSNEALTRAEITILDEYLTATLNIYRCMEELWEKGESHEILEIIGHEIGHIVGHPSIDLSRKAYKTWDQVRDANEILATVVGRLIVELIVMQKLANKKKR